MKHLISHKGKKIKIRKEIFGQGNVLFHNVCDVTSSAGISQWVG
jgi:hypothetical protein